MTGRYDGRRLSIGLIGRRAGRWWLLIAIAIPLCAVASTTLAAPSRAGGPSGIKIRVNRNGSIGRLLGTIRTGRCRLRGGSFRFRAGDPKLSVHVAIDDWKGFGHRYALTVGSPGKVFVDRANRGNGAYSTEFAIPGSTAGTTAVVRFAAKGSRISIGAPDLPNFDYSRFIYLRGAARCAIPEAAGRSPATAETSRTLGTATACGEIRMHGESAGASLRACPAGR